jgi:hypothetical protein
MPECSLVISLLVATVILSLNAVFASSASAQVLMQPNLSAAQARTIVDTIIAECSLPIPLVQRLELLPLRRTSVSG